MATLVHKTWDDKERKYVKSDYYNMDAVNRTLFFDVETTTRYKTYEEYLESEPNCAKEFARRTKSEGKWEGLTPAQIYNGTDESRGMLWAQHLQIISIAYRIWNPSTRKYEGKTIGFSSWEEYQSIEDKSTADRDLIIEFNEILYSHFGDERGILGGYNIVGFDIAVLWMRMMACGIKPHPSLNTVNKKPWDIDWVLDLQSWTNPAEHKGLSSFDTMNALLGVPSSKTDEHAGNYVCFRFWDDGDVEGINDYCMKDVMSSIALARRLSEDYIDNLHAQTMEDYVRRMEEKSSEKKED